MAIKTDLSIAEEHASTLRDWNSKNLRQWIKGQLSALAVMTKETIPAEVLNKYADILQETPIHKLKAAFRKSATQFKYFPKLPELLELCDELGEHATGEKQFLCPESCRCNGRGFIYGKYTKHYPHPSGHTEVKEYEGVYPCPERMKRGKSA